MVRDVKFLQKVLDIYLYTYGLMDSHDGRPLGILIHFWHLLRTTVSQVRVPLPK